MFRLLILNFLLISFVKGWFESCDYEFQLPDTSIYSVTTPGYPNLFANGSSCKWHLIAPVGHTIEIQCDFDMTPCSTSISSSQWIYVSVDGDKELENSERFCDYSSITRMSFGREISFGYTSNSNGFGWMHCKVQSIETTQENCNCGWSRNNGRIVGGENALPNEFIPVAGLIDATMKGSVEGPIFCGSAIISEFYALTAAHCFNVDRDISVIYLLVGDHDTSTGDDTPNAQLYKIQEIIKHANYIPESLEQFNDIALVRTVEDIKWKRTIGPACLPFAYNGYDNYFDGYPLVALGWGTTEYGGMTSNTLKKTNLNVIDSSECNRTYENIDETKICTFTKGTDTCQKDSGGSLYWTYDRRRYTIGIVSHGIYCAAGHPSVNTRVTFYLDWIIQNAPGALFCEK